MFDAELAREDLARLRVFDRLRDVAGRPKSLRADVAALEMSFYMRTSSRATRTGPR